jgi:hypothetical protein
VKSDYLWDGTGAPDPEVEQLERLLGRYRHQGRDVRPPRSQLRLLRATGALAALAAGVLFYLSFVTPAGYRVSDHAGDVSYARVGDVLEVGHERLWPGRGSGQVNKGRPRVDRGCGACHRS